MAPTLNLLETRQTSSDNCPDSISGGGIAGIVIGSIAGTLLLLWLWRVCSLPGARGDGEPIMAIAIMAVVGGSRLATDIAVDEVQHTMSM
ncbi:hypothetical protein BDV26DRAFT_258214 [Aspergillus bertholletiae]|uniref:Uncharacterized protein n=1 Tax=Aspergillus bertholletiae TaxID=1226010 RepID=A0A5N7BE96_9EURO|nr:hypothetical protein BDV26DRAFT_258214 [Aspergillus bertholletiae]